jgi:triphosphatase
VPTEIELKLAVAPRDLERLARDAGAHALAPAQAEELATEYFDTARHALWRKGLTLRLRRTPRGWIQGVKGGGTVEAGLHRRLESEAAVPRGAPDLGRVADPELATALRRTIGRARLEPVFRTEFTRRTCRLAPAPGSVIALCFDRGRLRAQEREETICEIELELEQGPAWRLYELALELEHKARVRVEQRAKAERGYALAAGERASPAKGASSAVREPMSALEAFRAICFACLAHLEANREGMLADRDEEYLHQMRVALRRLRSAFSVFSRLLPEPATEPPLDEIRWLARALGPARDWDVLLRARLGPVLASHPGHPGLAALQRAAERQRRAAHRTARRAVNSRRYQRLLLGLGAWLAGESWTSLLPLEAARALRQPVRGYASEALARRYRQVSRRGQGLARLDAAELHRLRIAVKKLRYTATFFAPLFAAREAAAMRGALTALQDALGAINDCVNAQRLLGELRRHARGAQLPEARQLVARANDAARAAERRKLKPAWKALRAARRFWE